MQSEAEQVPTYEVCLNFKKINKLCLYINIYKTHKLKIKKKMYLEKATSHFYIKKIITIISKPL